MTDPEPLAAETRGLVLRMLPDGAEGAATVAAACEWTVRAIADGNARLPLSRLAGRTRRQLLALASGEEEASGSGEPAPGADAQDPAFPDEDALAALLRAAPDVVFDAASGADPDASSAPFVLDRGALSTRRNHRCARRIRARLAAIGREPDLPVPDDPATLAGLTGEQLAAVRLLCAKSFSILSGGPGTGKTFTLARAVRLVRGDKPELRLCLAAPTGKAAARMKESLDASCARDGVPPPDHVEATTLHRLLGYNPVKGTLRHGPDNPLPADWVVIDETSMVDLLLFGHLLDALPPGARLTLIGDRDQLASVERGCVLRDLCDAGYPVARLTASKRFPPDGAIARFAAAVNGGDADAAVELLRAGDPDLEWNDHAAAADKGPAAWPGFAAAVREGFAAFAAARTPEEALARAADARVLCAVRKGPYGVDRVNDFVRSVLPREAPVPVMVAHNDRDQDVRNGDVGVVLPSDRDTVWLEPSVPDAPPRAVPRLLLPDLETAYATTVHKSQGSEYGTVAVVLPREDGCPLLTREILYTAVTRTRRGVRLWASEAAVRRCASTSVDRVTGLDG